MQEHDWVLVGVIHGAHGVRGLLKVESLSDNPARFVPGSRLYAKQQSAAGGQKPEQSEGAQARPLIVESATPHQGKLLISFAGIQSREDAEALLGLQLLAQPDAAPLPPGQYYHYQLEGLEVYERGAYLGRLSDILARPANDVYIVQAEAGGEIWIPALKSVVKNIDLKAGRMEVELPQGLAE
jgi:16S rRNA processing protein RimM